MTEQAPPQDQRSLGRQTRQTPPGASSFGISPHPLLVVSPTLPTARPSLLTMSRSAPPTSQPAVVGGSPSFGCVLSISPCLAASPFVPRLAPPRPPRLASPVLLGAPCLVIGAAHAHPSLVSRPPSAVLRLCCCAVFSHHRPRVHRRSHVASLPPPSHHTVVRGSPSCGSVSIPSIPPHCRQRFTLFRLCWTCIHRAPSDYRALTRPSHWLSSQDA